MKVPTVSTLFCWSILCAASLAQLVPTRKVIELPLIQRSTPVPGGIAKVVARAYLQPQGRVSQQAGRPLHARGLSTVEPESTAGHHVSKGHKVKAKKAKHHKGSGGSQTPSPAPGGKMSGSVAKHAPVSPPLKYIDSVLSWVTPITLGTPPQEVLASITLTEGGDNLFNAGSYHANASSTSTLVADKLGPNWSERRENSARRLCY